MKCIELGKSALFTTIVASVFAAGRVHAQEPGAAEMAAIQAEVDNCRTQPGQTVSFRIVTVQGAPVSQPATPEEERAVKDVLESANLPYDRANNQASYLATLAMIRVRREMLFNLGGIRDPDQMTKVRGCLSQLATDVGVDARFEDVGPALSQRPQSEPAASAPPCGPKGAFNLRFGDKAEKSVTVLRRTEAATVHLVGNANADSRFDRYEVSVDARTGEIFQVAAFKEITPKPRTSEAAAVSIDKAQASKRAFDFAAAYVSTLPPSLQAALVDEFGRGSWKGMISEYVQMHVIGSDFWEVAVICQDVRLAGAALKAAW